MRALILLSILVVTACGTPKLDLPGHATIDESFTPEQTEVILSALDAWKVRTNGVADLAPTIGNGGELHISPGRLDGQEIGIAHISHSGHVNMEIDLVTAARAAKINKVTRDDELFDTTLHELGHSFGLDHVAGGLMDPTAYGHGVIDPDTLSRFCDNYDCR